MVKIKTTSFNVNGMGNPVKRRIIFENLRTQKAEVHLIQETHSSPETGFLWAREWGGQIFYSHGTSNSRGVAILMSRNANFKVSTTIRDPEGRFVGIDIMVGEPKISLGNRQTSLKSSVVSSCNFNAHRLSLEEILIVFSIPPWTRTNRAPATYTVTKDGTLYVL